MDKFIENKNAKLFIKQSIIKNSDSAIILIHGLAEHSGRYEEFIKILNENGFSVFAIDLRGHGQTIGKKGDCEKINYVISDIDKIVEDVKNNYNFKKLGIFGHSIGGLLASLYSSLFKNIDFLVLSSPAIYCPSRLKIIKFIPYNLLRFIYIKKRHSESQQMLDYSRNDKFALKKFSIRTIGIFFNDAIKLLNQNLNINCPVLLIYGSKDRLLNEQHHFGEFMAKLKNKQNKIINYPEAKHRIVQNEGSKERIEDILDWLKNIIV